MLVLRLFFILFLGFGFSQAALAATNVVGTYTGSLSGTEMSPSAPFSDSVLIVIDSQSGATISGKITFSGINLSTTFSGSVMGTNTIDVVFNASATASAGGGFAGTFTGASLIIPNGTGSLVINGTSPIKTYDIGGTLAFSSAEVFDAENTSGTTLKSSGTIRTEINSIVSPVHSHLQKTMRGDAKGFKPNESGFLFEGESGINAGDLQLGNIGVWLNYNYTATENDFSRTAFESDSHNIIGGADYSPTNDYILGIAFSYESSETDTTFNQGNLESDGITFVPYLGILFNDTWSMDASFGYSWLSNDQYRVATGTTTRITSNPDSNRWFYSMNLNGITYYNNWIIGGRAGVLFAENETEAFSESDGTSVFERETTLGELAIGGDIAYSFSEFEPYLGAVYEYDFVFDEIVLTNGLQPANDRDDILLSGGFRYFGKQGLTANFEYSKRLLREEFVEDSIRMTVRYDW